MLPFDQVVCLDFETYYDDVYSLRKMSQTDYIWDDRFKVHSVGIKIIKPGEITRVYNHVDAKKALESIDWGRTAVLCHHTQFDGLILTHHYGIYPRFYLDTMSMARVVFGTDISVSLDAMARMLGLPGKEKRANLEAVKGLRVLPADLEADLMAYNADDVDDTVSIYEKIVRFVPERELKVIDITIRMYCEPVLEIDGDRVEACHKKEIEKKSKIFEEIGLPATELGSGPKFARHLEALGITPPMKMSPRTGRPTYAFALGDLAFKELLHHPDDAVRKLVEARVIAKSTLLESRSSAILRRRGLPTPIYLNVAGARTKRWSGGDGVNWQNLPKRGDAGELRRSLMAPEGCVLIIADASQIECRMNAWRSGQADIIEAFRRGDDIYCVNGSGIYGRTITAENDPLERFVSKTFTLGAGYGAGAPKINHMLKVGQFGPPVWQELEETQINVRNWRTANHMIVKNWAKNNDMMRTAFGYGQEVDDGIVCWEGKMRGGVMMGYLHGPDGLMMTYTDVRFSEDGRELFYVTKKGPVKLYGGIATENEIQFICRGLLADQMVDLDEEFPYMRIATTTHDEMVLVVPEEDAEEVARSVKARMSKPSPWCPDIPLDAEVKISPIYNKS